MTIRILVTGASGFIGRHLVERLLMEDVELAVTSRRPPEQDDPRVSTFRADVTARNWAERVIDAAAPDRVVHLAGLALGRNDPLLLASMFEANTAASVDLLGACLRSDIDRVVMAGTLEESYDGDDPVPTSPYAASKSAVTLFSRLVGGYGLDVINARIFMTYGPGQDNGKLIPSIVAEQLAGRVPKLRAPERRYDWIHVSDVADALAFLILRTEAPTTGFSEYDVGSGVMTSIADVAQLVGTHLDREQPWSSSTDPDRDVRVERCADVEQLNQLGWHASIDLVTGLESYAEWLRLRLLK